MVHVLCRARSLEAETFALERMELGKELLKGLQGFNRKVQDVTDYYSRIEGVAGRGNLVEMLLSPRVVPLLDAILCHSRAERPAHGEEPEAPTCKDGACGRSTTRENPGECPRCGRIQFASLVVRLDLSEEQERRARGIVARWQARLYEALALPREDDRSPFADLWLWTDEAEKTLELALPGGTETYAEMMERVNERAVHELAGILEPAQNERLDEIGIDLFWIHPLQAGR